MNIDGKKYLNIKPTFNFKEYFTGTSFASGFIQDRKGNVINRFDIKMFGSWKENKGELQEKFIYHSGKKGERTWKINMINNSIFTATAKDIVGTAKSKIFGNAIQWKYIMNVVVDNKSYKIKFDDWMWLLSNDQVMNRSYMSKFGFQVAEVTTFIYKK